MSEKSSLNHIAIIMDGNRRWGKENNLSLKSAYEKGAENVRIIVEELIKKNIPNLTLYGLSKENLNRSKIEIDIIFSIFIKYLDNEIDNLNKNNIRLKIIGNFKHLPKSMQDKISNAEKQTANNDKLNLFIAFSYSAKEEIIDAIGDFAKDQDGNFQNINEESFSKFMYYKEMKEVDLLIRTGGEMRISNFLLWHIAYAELYFTKKYWPEFDSSQLDLAIKEYESRKRNFGAR